MRAHAFAMRHSCLHACMARRARTTATHHAQVLELSKQQEVTKQTESKEREAEFRKQLALLEKERELARFKEERELEETRAQVRVCVRLGATVPPTVAVR